MKIIGETTDDFITILSTDEIAKLSGYGSKYSASFNKPKIGSNIDISYLYEKVTKIEELLDKGLGEAIDALTSKVKLLNGTKNLFEKIVKKDETN